MGNMIFNTSCGPFPPAFRMEECGKLQTVDSLRSSAFRLSVGFETLDRELFDPEECYELLGKSGVKWARCQSGWSRCEKSPGVYDFAWLDRVVDRFREIGIQPQVLICRCTEPMEPEQKKKLALFTNINEDAVISGHDALYTIYEIPINYWKEGINEAILSRMGVTQRTPDLSKWQTIVDTLKHTDKRVRIAMVGKYIQLEDAYKSIDEAVRHGGFENKAKISFKKIDSEEAEKLSDEEFAAQFDDIDAILIPGGFGERGINGMVKAAEFARKNKIPFLGICLGLQIMVIEYARNVLGYEDANSSEFRPESPHCVVSLLEEQVDVTQYGGTMRLGLSESRIGKGTKIYEAYGTESILERHRHRYEVSNRYKQELRDKGLIISGMTPDGELVESVEWPDHPWSTGVQFHPEFTSRPTKAGPLFREFVKAALEYRANRKQSPNTAE